jgi:hypothetical protein
MVRDCRWQSDVAEANYGDIEVEIFFRNEARDSAGL